jgi:hypothetical protein
MTTATIRIDRLIGLSALRKSWRDHRFQDVVAFTFDSEGLLRAEITGNHSPWDTPNFFQTLCIAVQAVDRGCKLELIQSDDKGGTPRGLRC